MIQLLYNRKANAALVNLCAGGRLPHAMLLEGPSGVGKKTAARLIAMAALCGSEQKPCGNCAHCVKVEKGIHPDVRYYTVPEGKKEFPVELVREIRQDAYISPNEGVCKLYVIDQAHRMNTAAQNALLKVVEEPPSFVAFVLLCENRSQMLPTILSRVTSIELEIPSVEQCAQALATLSPDYTDPQRLAAAAGAGGNIGRALGLLGSAKPSKAAADASRLREALIFENRYESLKVFSAYEKDRDGLLQTLALLKEGFAQIAVGREADQRYGSRVPAVRALSMVAAVDMAMKRTNQNVSVALLCACMVEQVKGALS